MNKPKIIGITMPRPFHGMAIPIAIQSAYIRDYCSKNGFIFSLPQTEIYYNNSYYILCSLLRQDINSKLRLALASILMLPISNNQILDKILDIRKQDNLEWHFPLENLILNSSEIKLWATNFNLMNQYTQKLSEARPWMGSLIQN